MFKLLNLTIKKACISIDTGLYGNSTLYQLTGVNNDHTDNNGELIHLYTLIVVLFFPKSGFN